jgi:hypothetical protein
MATDYKGSRDMQVTTGCNPNGLDTIHGLKIKNGSAAPRQILDIQLFQWFPLIADEFRYGTSSIGKDISLPFHGVQEHPNYMLYATWASFFMWISPEWVGLCILKLFRQLWSNLILFGHGTYDIGNFISSSLGAYIERLNPISYVSCTLI